MMSVVNKRVYIIPGWMYDITDLKFLIGYRFNAPVLRKIAGMVIKVGI